jgi:hypothetical protein
VTGRSNEQSELQCCRGALWEKLYNWVTTFYAFSDYAAEKWPLSRQQKLGVKDARRICSCSKACGS